MIQLQSITLSLDLSVYYRACNLAYRDDLSFRTETFGCRERISISIKRSELGIGGDKSCFAKSDSAFELVRSRHILSVLRKGHSRQTLASICRSEKVQTEWEYMGRTHL